MENKLQTQHTVMFEIDRFNEELIFGSSYDSFIMDR